MTTPNLCLVLTDVDGTLLAHGGRVTSQAIAAINRLNRYGVAFGLATGRMPSGVTRIVSDIDVACHLILYSGAYVVNAQGDVIASHTIDSIYAKIILKHCQEQFASLAPSFFEGKEWLTSDAHASNITREAQVVGAAPHETDLYAHLAKGHTPNKLFYSCRGDSELAREVTAAIQTLELPVHVIASNTTGIVEVLPCNVNKCNGARSLCSSLNLELSSVVFFGDDTNDIELLKNSGLGIAMANGSVDAKSAADRIAPASEEDGFAQYLNYLIDTNTFAVAKGV